MEEKADLLAMGTAAGTVLIYSTAKGALQCTLVSGSHAQLISQSLECPVFLSIDHFVTTATVIYTKYNFGHNVHIILICVLWLFCDHCCHRLSGWRPQWRSQLCSVAP